MKKMVVFNWKMNPGSKNEAKRLAEAVREAKKNSNFKVVICPPFVYLENLIKEFKEIEFGAQNCFWEEKGSFTGEISCKMLKNLGARFVILGHSERRRYFKETNEEIAKKTMSVIENKLIPIFCIGETLEERKKNLTKKVLKNQLLSSLKEVFNLKFKNFRLIVAYEPIWAIGIGRTCKVEDALETICYLKKILLDFLPLSSLLFFYGGSINSKNIFLFLKEKEIDGVLVGRASLKEKEIISMLS
ncbi:triose-phosphate isomerase [bacterium]|nr:triose-phosphate isomerase [bacterium]